tara:strand:+ start:6238 stop:6465 length:228 start_codon:yes stop_codon:yes gene_type:complete
LINKTCVDNKKIKGSISNKIEAEFKNDKKTRKKKLRLTFLKNSISSRIFAISITKKKIDKTLKNETLNKLIKNFI